MDLPAKLTGQPCYLSDLVLPGQVHARVVRPPSRRARLITAPKDAIQAMPGVRLVVEQGDFLAVVAEREETAVRAAARLAAESQWHECDSLPDEWSLPTFLTGSPADGETLLDAGSDPAAETGCETHRVAVGFSRPFLAHASIATSTALALWDGGLMQVWTSSQGIHHLRSALAAALDLAEAAVVVQHVQSAGCYGHNGADDAAYDAALTARNVPGRPVRLVWSRQDELSWSPVGPAMRVQIAAALDHDGRVCNWRQDIWSNGHTSRPGPTAVPALLGFAQANRIDLPVAGDPPHPRGGGSGRNGVAGYNVGRQLVRTHRLTTMPLRTSAMRALGAHLNVFAIESVMDELAALAGNDPLAFRLAHLDDPRGREVLRLVTERAGWRPRSGPANEPAAVGWGIGYARYKAVGAYCAVVAEVEAVDDVRVRQLTVAVDVGTVVNPDGVVNQIEGGAIQSLSWTLKERVRFNRRGVTSDTWDSYPIVRFSEVPRVEVVLVPSEAPPLGAGEASVGPTAAAIGNALAAAVGVRVRELPLTREAVIRAIENG